MNAISHTTDVGYKGEVHKSLERAQASLLSRPDNHARGYLVVSTTEDLRRHLEEMENATGFQIPNCQLSDTVKQLSEEESLKHRVPVWLPFDTVLVKYCDDSQCVTPEKRAKWFREILEEVDSYQLDGKDLAHLVGELEGKMNDRARKVRRELYGYQSLMLRILKQTSLQIEEGDTVSGKKLKEKALSIVEEMLRILQ